MSSEAMSGRVMSINNAFWGSNTNSRSHHQHGAEAGTQKIEEIDATDVHAPARERQADAAGGEKERYEEHEVQKTQIGELPRIPDHFQRVEGHALAEREAQHHRDAKQQRTCRKRRFEASFQLRFEKRDERAAGTVTEQRKADDHVREVMPLHDGKRPHQQKFVADRTCGNEQRC